MPQSPGEAVEPTAPPGQLALQRLQQAGYTPDKLAAYKQVMQQRLAAAGYTPDKQAAYFGDQPYTPQSITNLGARMTYQGGEPGIKPGTPVASNAWEELQAGWGNTGLGRLISGGDPKFVTNPHSGFWGSIANVAGGTAGDLPASLAGSAIGGTEGAGAGAAAGGGPEDVPADFAGLWSGSAFGASAAPTAFRHAVIDAQDQGKNLSLQDIAGQIFDTTRDGLVGMVTFGAGKGVGKTLVDKTGSRLIGMSGELATQAVGQATLGAAAHGRLPTTQDFTAAVVGTIGTHVAFNGPGRLSEAGLRLTRNLQELYKQNPTLTPDVVAAAAAKNPALREELLQQDIHGDPVAPTLSAMSGPEPSFMGKALKANDPPLVSQPNFQEGVGRLLDVIGGNEHLRGGDPDTAVSTTGARGYFQIEPGTARQYMGKDFDVSSLSNRAVNEYVSKKIITDLYRKSGGDEAAVLVGYNAGPGRMHSYLNAGPGTRLEAVRDNSVHGGWRYEKVSSVRDESFLPLETQKYVAQGRVRMQEGSGKSLGGGNGPAGGEIDEQPQLEAAAREEEAATRAKLDEQEGQDKADLDEAQRQENSDGGGDGGGREGGEGGDSELPPQKMDVEDAYAKMGGMIAPETKEPVAGGLLKLLNPTRLYSQFVSEMGNARHIDSIIADHEGKPDKNAWTSEDAIRNTYASEQRAITMLRPIIMDAASQAKKAGVDESRWTQWMMAARSEDKRLQGVDAFGKDDDAKNAAHTLATDPTEIARYAEPTGTLQKGWDNVLDYGRSKGLWTDERVNGPTGMKALNPIYLAMQRDQATIGTGSGGGAVGGFDPVRKLTGSDEQVVDPLHSTFRNAVRIVTVADKNEAAGFFADAANRGALGDLISKVATLDPRQVLKPGEDDQGENILNPEFAFVPHQLKPNEFSFINDGKREIYAIKSTKSIDGEAMAQLIQGADSPGQANILLKTAQTMAGLERQGIIGDPMFPIHVQLLHIVQAFVTDPAHPFPGVAFASGLKDAMSMGTRNETPTLRAWLMNGGGGAELVQMDVKALDRNISDVLGETGALQKLNDMNPLMAFRAASLRMGVASRIGYYKSQIAKGVDPQKAAMQSRSAFVDYSEHATLDMVNQWSKIVPFMRPGILIADNVGRAVKERPISTSLYALASLTVPTLALGVLNRLQDKTLPDGQKFSDIPAYEKDTSLILPSIAGVRLRIPLPKQLGMVFAGLPNRIMDAAIEGDDPKFREWGWQFLQSWVPPISPAVATPLAENTTNHNFFTGRPMIPGSLANQSGPMQYTDATSYTARKIDQVLGPAWHGMTGNELSPIQLDNMVKGYTGVLGQGLVSALDVPMRAMDKEMTPPDHGFFNHEASIFAGSFIVRNPGASARSVSDFYDQYKAFQTAAADKAGAIERAANGQPEELHELMEKSENPEAYIRLSGITSSLRTIRMSINAIGVNKDMSTEEKRQEIDRLYGDMVQIAKGGQEAIKAVQSAKQKSQQEMDQPDLSSGLAPPQ